MQLVDGSQKKMAETCGITLAYASVRKVQVYDQLFDNFEREAKRKSATHSDLLVESKNEQYTSEILKDI